ncbi:SPFH domain-containing protein [Chromobacterium alticapitis]|nr:SPFH domain-containing protein [Chromobacterium alticapitis]
MTPHNHEHHDERGNGPPRRWPRLAGVLALVLTLLSCCMLQVRSGEAVVITRFGDPVRVLLQPGLAWRLPQPFESALPVDLRLRATSSGLQDVGTRDGLRVIMQAYVAWQVPADAVHITRFLRAMRNQPDEAARQIRTFIGSALETGSSGFALTSLVNTDPGQLRLAEFERQLRRQLSQQLLDSYGVRVVDVGLERLTLPAVTLDATVARMRAERDTLAAERTAAGNEQAAAIRADAARDARVLRANASVEAARIEAQSQVEAARVYGAAYQSDPALYRTLRSLDTLDHIVNANTRLILRTDAAPFRALVEGPPGLEAKPAKAGKQ